MLLEYFADGIFTTQQVVIFCTVAFLALGTFIGFLIFVGRKLIEKGQEGELTLVRSLLIGFLIISLIILIIFVIPTKVEDARWERMQSECAKKVGYASPAEDNSNIATIESQYAYRQCLNF